MPGHTLPPPETMTVAQAAHQLGLSERTAYSMVDNGAIPSLRIGNRILILKSVVRALLDAGSLAPQPVGDNVW